jgi:hypothetical protein
MRDTTLMQMALGLTPPWTVTGSDFDAAAGRIDIRIDFPAGSRFACPSCSSTNCAVHDTEAEVLAPPQLLPASGLSERPRATCAMRHMWHPHHKRALGGAGQGSIGLADGMPAEGRPESGFTLLFEANQTTVF